MNLVNFYKSASALLIAAGCVSTAQAAVDIQATTDQSQVTLVSPSRHITIPLPAFSFDGSEDTVRVLFSKPLLLEYFGPGSGFTGLEFTADSDGSGNGTNHQSGVTQLLDSSLAAIPEYTDAGTHSDLVGGTTLTISPRAAPLIPGDGKAFTVYGLYFQAAQNFDAANLTNGQLLLTTSNYNGSIATPGNITVVPEPTSLALLGLGGLLVARRRR